MSKLFRNPRAAVVAIAIFPLLILIAFATECRGAELSFEAGRAVIHGETPALALSLGFADRQSRTDFTYACGILLIGENGPNANQLAAQCQVIDGFRRLDLGLGAVYLQNTDQWNGSHLNFSLLARYRFTDRWSLAWRHFSNAGTKYPNIGRDMVLVGYRF